MEEAGAGGVGADQDPARASDCAFPAPSAGHSYGRGFALRRR